MNNHFFVHNYAITLQVEVVAIRLIYHKVNLLYLNILPIEFDSSCNYLNIYFGIELVLFHSLCNCYC